MLRTLLIAGLAAGLSTTLAHAQDRSQMSFFISSTNPGQGANFGGLEGADRHCQALAAAVGAGGRTWRAYLSTSPADGRPAVHARDRIGQGPWRNATGVVVAQNVEDLHGDPNINKQTALTERGTVVNGRGDTPNQHDILTGSTPEGRAIEGERNLTCGNWTSADAGSAMTGHHDRTGLDSSAAARSWNSSHPSRGCSIPALNATGGAGFIYCFAAN
jgi:hypothetical protein